MELQDEKEETVRKQQEARNSLKGNEQHARELQDEFKGHNIKMIPEDQGGKCDGGTMKQSLIRIFPKVGAGAIA